jgi:hypothetical protein
MVNMLLEWQLNQLGYSRAQYNAETYGIGRETEREQEHAEEKKSG